MNKTKLIFEIIILIVALTWAIYKVTIPEYKESKGSSDSLINSKKYESLVEFKINNTNFGLVIDKNKNISNILCFDITSTCLYNQNIESNDFEGSINQLIRKLIEKDYLKNNYTVVLTKYEDKYYEEVKNTFIEYSSKYKMNVIIMEEKNDILLKTKELTKENTDSKESALYYLDMYSKELIEISKNEENNIEEVLDEKTSKIYANNIYKKIEKYVLVNNIKNIDKANKELDMKTISGDENNKIFPSSSSYFYVKNSKVYAYIKIKDKENSYEYCYNGSIDDYKEGVCE